LIIQLTPRTVIWKFTTANTVHVVVREESSMTYLPKIVTEYDPATAVEKVAVTIHWLAVKVLHWKVGAPPISGPANPKVTTELKLT